MSLSYRCERIKRSSAGNKHNKSTTWVRFPNRFSAGNALTESIKCAVIKQPNLWSESVINLKRDLKMSPLALCASLALIGHCLASQLQRPRFTQCTGKLVVKKTADCDRKNGDYLIWLKNGRSSTSQLIPRVEIGYIWTGRALRSSEGSWMFGYSCFASILRFMWQVFIVKYCLLSEFPTARGDLTNAVSNQTAATADHSHNLTWALRCCIKKYSTRKA